MHKTEFVEKVAKKAKMSKAGTAKVIDAALEVITKALKGNEPVVLTGFGKFEARRRKARTGRNPQTGRPLKVPAKKVPAFKAGKALKDAVAKKR